VKHTSLRSAFSEYIPAELDEGTLYISMDYATAVHLCACGCRSKVVTPFGPADWQLTFDGTVTLSPSIGNGQLPCRSHYYIHHDHIQWVRKMSASATPEANQRDQAALRHLHARHAEQQPWWRRYATRARAIIERSRP
jgi:hypothetical protein